MSNFINWLLPRLIMCAVFYWSGYRFREFKLKRDWENHWFRFEISKQDVDHSPDALPRAGKIAWNLTTRKICGARIEIGDNEEESIFHVTKIFLDGNESVLPVVQGDVAYFDFIQDD